MNIQELISENKYEKKIVKVPLGLIDRGINVNPRSQLVMENVDNLVESGDFPEIHLGYLNDKLIIVDGYHRDLAAQRLGQPDILAYITKYETLSDLKKDAFKENVNHGVKLTEYDIAAWIYKNFLEVSKITPTISLASFSRQCDISERRGSAIYKWYLFHKEILEDDEVKVKTDECEKFYSLLSHFGEVPGDVTEEFKIKFKEFYFKYGNGKLNRPDLKEAIDLFKEGKDFNEEKEKERLKEKEELEKSEKIVDDMEKKDREEYFNSFEPIGSDAVDRVGNADYSKREIEHPNNLVNNLMKEHEEYEKINSEIKEEVGKEGNKTTIIYADKMIEALSKSVMSLSVLNSKNKVKFSYENLKSLESIMDRVQEIIESLNPEELIKEKEENSI